MVAEMLGVNMFKLFLLIAVMMWSSPGNFSEAEKVEQDVHVDENATMNTEVRRLPLLGSSNTTEMAYGFVANSIAVILYGSNFVPVKKIETGDVSMIGDLILHSPKFHPLAMLGGAAWATGSLTVVPVVKAIGLGLGVCIWGSSSLLMGWISSRFGWFGIEAQEVARPVLNYCGAGLCLLSGLILFFVRTNVGELPHSECTPLLINRIVNSGVYGPSESWVDVMGAKRKRCVGCLLAVVAGLLYGASFVPILYIKSHVADHDSICYGASLYDLDYVFAMCCGIYLTSTVYFSIYCVAMRNRPRVFSRAILPGFLSGLMWTLATYCWFLANNYLSAVVTFPIVCAGNCLVAALWGCLVFKEVKGLVNCSIFIVASCVVLTGSMLTSFSNV
ncbi:transmembrane protein 144 isoform X2 [Oncorhynchus mykiss]|uniref:transmembrane protein 144 isoform X2 n=1 Tax=Oncorhynchus mykiss TaxID=8022 RepID=UPI000B4F2E2B|nr:transmembrane protein 144 isoform X2 [Oncorhynchus mykiss]